MYWSEGKGGETIQRRRLNKGGYYTRKYGKLLTKKNYYIQAILSILREGIHKQSERNDWQTLMVLCCWALIEK